jgi:DNA-binding Lrp family transcriptional regulator
MDLAARLLNEGQRGFPLLPRPFQALGRHFGATEDDTLAACAGLAARGAISRVGGVWAPGVGGAALLCAMAVPPPRLEAVAALVSAHPGVNHNYEREHALNLWFVMTNTSSAGVDTALSAIENEANLPVTRLRMVRPYRIDLGFDLHRPATAGVALQRRAPRVQDADRPLAALVEAGLPLVPEPFAAWAGELRCPAADVPRRIQSWLDAGTLRRFGLVVRHHEAGYAANAMTVFDVPDGAADACGARLAVQPGVTLCYQRERAAGWRYNLYCMVHGRHRDETLGLLHHAIAGAGLAGWPRQVLFSRRRFKQTGARYFRPSPEPRHAD